jgi:hypothetical protein
MTSASPTADRSGQSARAGEVGQPADSGDPAGDTAHPAGGTGRSIARIRIDLRRPATVDVAVCAALIVAAMVLTHGLLADPATRVLALNPGDQALVEWLLALGTRFWTGDLHLITYLLNAPDGINLLANASMLTLGVLLAPITLTAGAPVSFAIAVTANLAATGIAWYLLLSRTLRLHRAAAATGAAFCAYAPGMITQSNAHLHMTAQWLVPAIVWCVVRLARADPGRPAVILRTGLLLGAVICVQLFAGEEVLLLAAATLALFCVAYALIAPRRAARALIPLGTGLAVAAGTALLVLAYPLWFQFAGPQHVPNGPFSAAFFSADLAEFWSYPLQSWGGGSPEAAKLVTGPAEYNAFFGIPLIMVVAAATVWLWRRPLVIAAMAAGLVMGALALGPKLKINGVPTTHTGPYQLIADLPAVDGALPTRFTLALIPIIAIVLATAIDRALRDDRRTVRLVVPAIVALGLLPLVPVPLPTMARAPVPRFFTDGDWRGCVRPGGTLVPVPLPDPADPDKMRWAAAANARFAIPEGFFIGPYASGGRASVGVFSRPTSQLLKQVGTTGEVPVITPVEQAQARDDVGYWHASCLVLADRDQIHVAALRQTMDLLFGTGQPVTDVTVWRVGSTR